MAYLRKPRQSPGRTGREELSNALVSLALLTEQVLGGDLEVVKVESAGRGSADTELGDGFRVRASAE